MKRKTTDDGILDAYEKGELKSVSPSKAELKRRKEAATATIDRKGGVIFAVLGVGGTILATLIGLWLLSLRSARGIESLAEAVLAVLNTARIWVLSVLAIAAVAGY